MRLQMRPWAGKTIMFSSFPLVKMVARGGVEPPTYRFSDVGPTVQTASAVAPVLVSGIRATSATG